MPTSGIAADDLRGVFAVPPLPREQTTRRAIDLDAAAKVADAPEPEVKIDREAFTPALVNNPELTKQFVKIFEETLGKERVYERSMSMGGEDFSRFIRAGIPGFYWHIGTAPPARVKEWKEGGKPVANTHSDAYYPVPEPTIKTGVLTMTMGVLVVAC